MTAADILTIVMIAMPLIAKAVTDWSTNTKASHNMALARITGMAGREAATIARSLLEAPIGTSKADLERTLISNSVSSILNQMATSTAATGATAPKLTGIVQGELDKILTSITGPKTVVVAAPAAT